MQDTFSTPSKVVICCSAAAYIVAVGTCLYLNIVAAPSIAVGLLWTFVDAMMLAIFGVCGTGALVIGIEALTQILVDGKVSKKEEKSSNELDSFKVQTAQ